MTASDIRAVLAEEFRRIAPEIAFDDVAPDDDLRDAFDIDSIDFLNLVIALHQRLGIDIPESDYARLGTLRALADYLEAAAAA